MDKQIIVLGAGGHAKVLIDALLIQKANILGIVDEDLTKVGTSIFGVPIIGNDASVLAYSATSVSLVNGIGSIGSTNERRRIFVQFKDKGYDFFTVIHPSAIIASGVKLAEGVQIMAGAIIQTGCIIGKNTIINTKASIDHDGEIKEHVHIAPGATISGGAKVDEGTHFGTGAVAVQGIIIGKQCIVGAGAVVISDVPHNSMAVGVPAKIIKGIV